MSRALAEQLDAVAPRRPARRACRGRRGRPRRTGPCRRARGPPSAYSAMPFSATRRPTPPTSSSSSPTPSSARTAARAGRVAARTGARSTPLPTTRRPSARRRTACSGAGVVGVLEQLGVRRTSAATASAPSTSARLRRPVGSPHPEPVAGVDDDRDADQPAEHPAEHAGLRVVGVQDVQPQPAQHAGPARGPRRRSCRRPPGAGQRVERHVRDAERLDPLDVRPGR